MKKDIKNPNTEREKIYRLYADTLKKLKNNIRNARREKGFRSAEKFAEHLGVSLKTVQGWENLDNDRWPELPMVLNVCDKTGCDIDYLLDRMKEPTHDIKFIHEKTGLSVKAIEKLIALKGTGMEDLISDIITHKNAARLLRVLLLAADEDEIAWIDLDSIPRELLSSYADKPMDFSVGIGLDVADFLASQEMVSIIRSIREKREKEKHTKQENREHHWMELLKPQYDVYKAKRNRRKMLARLESDCNDLDGDIKGMHDPDMISRAEKILDKLSTLYTRIRIVSFAEWKTGNIEKEYNKIYGEEENNNGQH